MERDAGFYWVKWQGDWVIAEFYNPDPGPYSTCFGEFTMCGDDRGRLDGEFEEINENRIICPHE